MRNELICLLSLFLTFSTVCMGDNQIINELHITQDSHNDHSNKDNTNTSFTPLNYGTLNNDYFNNILNYIDLTPEEALNILHLIKKKIGSTFREKNDNDRLRLFYQHGNVAQINNALQTMNSSTELKKIIKEATPFKKCFARFYFASQNASVVVNGKDNHDVFMLALYLYFLEQLKNDLVNPVGFSWWQKLPVSIKKAMEDVGLKNIHLSERTKTMVRFLNFHPQVLNLLKTDDKNIVLTQFREAKNKITLEGTILNSIICCLPICCAICIDMIPEADSDNDDNDDDNGMAAFTMMHMGM